MNERQRRGLNSGRSRATCDAARVGRFSPHPGPDPALVNPVMEGWRRQLKADVTRGVENREFTVVYEPIVDLASTRTIGVETLMRWNHPQHGLITPTTLAMAGEIALMVPVGNYVLDEACRQLRVWLDQRIGDELMLNVTMSAAQLHQPGFVDLVSAILRRWDLPAAALNLELTETLPTAPAAEHVLLSLRELGVRIGVGGFGTGYSSFNYLSRLPVDVLKLSRNLVTPLATGAPDTDLVAGILDVAASRGLMVIAEGVETVEQLAVLTLLGCQAGQGYHFMPPVSPTDMTAALIAAQSEPAERPQGLPETSQANTETDHPGVAGGNRDAAAPPPPAPVRGD